MYLLSGVEKEEPPSGELDWTVLGPAFREFANPNCVVDLYRVQLINFAGVPATSKKHAISEQTVYLWRKKFGTLEAADVKRLKQLELENGRLKKLVAERDLDIEILKEVAAKKW
jgi:putative transposase